MRTPDAYRPQVTKLPCGVTVASERSARMRTVAIGVWVRAGARDERDAEHGLSHFLEHMAFKGTRRRSAREIVEEIEGVGGDLNAETTVEHTAYYARVMERDIGVALDILADILLNSVFDPAEIDREKGVILQEIAAVDDDPEDLTSDAFLHTAFPDHPIGRPILGTVETVSAFSRRAIHGYLARNYVTDGIVVVATGAVKHDELVSLVDGKLGAASRKALPNRSAALYRGGERRIARRLEQVHLMLGFPGLAYGHPDLYALGVFSGALGGGMSSRLFQEVREKRGLAYGIDSFYWSFADCGVFGMTAGASERGVADLVPVSLDVLTGATASLTDVEVERAKAQMRVSLMSGYESPGRRTEQIARQIIVHGRVLTASEILARIDAVTTEEVRKVGLRVLGGAPTVVATGPLRRVPRLDAIAARIGAPAAS